VIEHGADLLPRLAVHGHPQTIDPVPCGPLALPCHVARLHLVEPQASKTRIATEQCLSCHRAPRENMRWCAVRLLFAHAFECSHPIAFARTCTNNRRNPPSHPGVRQAQAEHMIQPDGAADDFSRTAMTIVRVG